MLIEHKRPCFRFELNKQLGGYLPQWSSSVLSPQSFMPSHSRLLSMQRLFAHLNFPGQALTENIRFRLWHGLSMSEKMGYGYLSVKWIPSLRSDGKKASNSAEKPLFTWDLSELNTTRTLLVLLMTTVLPFFSPHSLRNNHTTITQPSHHHLDLIYTQQHSYLRDTLVKMSHVGRLVSYIIMMSSGNLRYKCKQTRMSMKIN